MTESFWIAVIAGIFTIAGTIVGYIASIFQSKMQHQHQKELNLMQRNWQIQDRELEYQLSVRQRRWDQAEQFVSAMTQDFHQFRSHAIFLVNADAKEGTDDQVFEFAYWQKYIDKNVFQYGPVIGALSISSSDLESSWKKMEQAWQNMAHHYQFLYEQKVLRGQNIDNSQEMLQAIYDVYGAYNDGLKQFIVQIDKLRQSSFQIEEQAKANHDKHNTAAKRDAQRNHS
ncbi:MAG TPA: hypothetical protein VK206_07260 [Anaerolineales bacterium]|nr:hypothetical protein [Anaerolineales bacterium]